MTTGAKSQPSYNKPDQYGLAPLHWAAMTDKLATLSLTAPELANFLSISAGTNQSQVKQATAIATHKAMVAEVCDWTPLTAFDLGHYYKAQGLTPPTAPRSPTPAQQQTLLFPADEALLKYYMPLSVIEAHRLSHIHRLPVGEIENDALGILWRSVLSYDPAKGVLFTTHAKFKLSFIPAGRRRAVDLRSSHTQTECRLMEVVAEKLRRELNRTPTDEEVALDSKLTVEDIRLLRESKAWTRMSLDAPLDADEAGDGITLYDQVEGQSPNPARAAQAREMIGYIAKAVSRISAAQRQIILLIDVEKLTQKEICLVTGKSKKEVSLRYTQAKAALRTQLTGKSEASPPGMKPERVRITGRKKVSRRANKPESIRKSLLFLKP